MNPDEKPVEQRNEDLAAAGERVFGQQFRQKLAELESESPTTSTERFMRWLNGDDPAATPNQRTEKETDEHGR